MTLATKTKQMENKNNETKILAVRCDTERLGRLKAETVPRIENCASENLVILAANF